MLLTCTVLMIVPTRFGVTIIVTVTLLPLLKSPRSQVTVLPVCAQLPAVEVAETNCAFAGSVSVNGTPAAEPDPLSITTILYVNCAPLDPGSGESDFTTDRSTAGRSSCAKMPPFALGTRLSELDWKAVTNPSAEIVGH